MKARIEFLRQPIVPPVREPALPEIGACLEFWGIVRATENGEKIAGLYYETYEPMARTELQKIFQELCAKNPCEEILFVHRLEFVPAGEASLFIRVCSERRKASMAVLEELIDRLKADVPIWKKTAES